MQDATTVLHCGSGRSHAIAHARWAALSREVQMLAFSRNVPEQNKYGRVLREALQYVEAPRVRLTRAISLE